MSGVCKFSDDRRLLLSSLGDGANSKFQAETGPTFEDEMRSSDTDDPDAEN